MLAIAAPSFNQPSETFIRDHVRTIAPSETVLICHERKLTITSLLPKSAASSYGSSFIILGVR